MALENYLDSSYQPAVSTVAPSRVAGGQLQSSSSSGIFFHGEGQAQVLPSSHQFNSSFMNSSASIETSGLSGLGSISGGDMSRTLNSAANSGPSVGASSLVTDANSALSGGPHLQRSASINAESYNRLPASPMSFSSNNISISGSSVLDGSSLVQQSPNQENTPHIPYRHQQQGTSTANSHMKMPAGQLDSSGMHLQSSLIQEPNSSLPAQKKARLVSKHEDFLQQQVIQQLFQRQDSVPLQAHHSHVQAIYRQKMLQQRQQQQYLQSLPQMQRLQFPQQHPQRLRLQPQQEAQPPYARRYEVGICARRIMQYLYHQRHRPPDNSILYWRKFVAEYFSPRAKRRWCLSMYGNVGQHALGVLSQTAKDSWHCDICVSNSGKGFEATYDVLPRLCKIKFDSGMIDEFLFPGMPQESRFTNGMMMLECGKAILESVYEHFRVVQEGCLRIIFTPELKILSWEFCILRHEELLPRRLVAPQVSQLVQVAQKYQGTVNDGGSSGASVQDLETNCSMFVTAGRQLVKNVELQSLNELGFSKGYVRNLQIAEVFNSMKDLIDFSREHNISPIESLKTYPLHTAAAKMQVHKVQEMGQQLVNTQSLSADQNDTLNKIVAMNPGLGSHLNNNMGGGTPNNMGQNVITASKYQNLLRQNSMNSSSTASQLDENHCSSLSQTQASAYEVHNPAVSAQNATGNVFASSRPLQNAMKHVQPLSQGNPNSQQDAIQHLFQMIGNNNAGVHQKPLGGGLNPSFASADGIFHGLGATGAIPPIMGGADMVGFGSNSPALSNNQVPSFPSATNSFKSFSDISPTVSGNSYGMKQAVHDLVPDIPRQFSDSTIFDDDFWKS